MITARRSLTTLFILLFCLSIASAQQKSGAIQHSRAPVVTATASTEGVDYVSVGRVHQTRLQLFSPDGRQVFDSDFQLGNLVSWRLQDQQGLRLTAGAYLYLITVKDFSDSLTQKYGIAVLEREHVYLQQTVRDELSPAQSTALEANRKAATLTPVDRIGVTALNAPNTASTDGDTVIEAAPAGNNGTASKLTAGGENINGIGTTNKIAKWVDDNGTLGDSAITENSSGRVSIGAPSDLPVKLNVFSPFGTIPFSFTQDAPASSFPTLALFSTADGSIGQYAATIHNGEVTFLMGATSGRNFGMFSNNSYNAPNLFINFDGRIGMGTTNPTAALHIQAANGATDSTGVGANGVSSLRAVGGVGGTGIGSNGPGLGGSASITGGNGGVSENFGGQGGAVEFLGGNGGSPSVAGSSGNGGFIRLQGGNAGLYSTSTAGAGGHLSLSGGDGGESIAGSGGRGGAIFIEPGQGGRSSGGNGRGPAGYVRMAINEGRNVAIGFANQVDGPRAKLQVADGDIYIFTKSRGLILRATDGENCYRLTVNNAGVLSTTLIPCP